MVSAFTHLLRAIFLTMTAFLLWSCEQLITVKLQGGQDNVVVESFVTNGRGPFYVKLSQSQDYYNQSAMAGIEKAVVQMVDSTLSENLVERGSGYYSTTKIKGTSGHTYHLNVTASGKKYSATVKLPPPVRIDTVYFRPDPNVKDSLNVFVEFQDPGGVENFYRIKLYRNGRFAVNDYYLITDTYIDGQRLFSPFYYREFARGDTVLVELENIERSTWRYFKGLSETIQQGVNLQAPGTPPSNLSGGALGYFGAWGTSTYRVIIRK